MGKLTINLCEELHQKIREDVAADESLTPEELKRYCIQSPMLSSYKWPRSFTLVKELPHTATGKLMHYKLRQQIMKQQN